MAVAFQYPAPVQPAQRPARTWLVSVGYFAFVVMTLAFVWFAPRPGQNVAVLVSPFADAARAGEVVGAAGADIVERGRWPSLMIIKPSSSQTVAQLYKAGAWLVFNPNAVGGCFQTA